MNRLALFNQICHTIVNAALLIVICYVFLFREAINISGFVYVSNDGIYVKTSEYSQFNVDFNRKEPISIQSILPIDVNVKTQSFRPIEVRLSPDTPIPVTVLDTVYIQDRHPPAIPKLNR